MVVRTLPHLRRPPIIGASTWHAQTGAMGAAAATCGRASWKWWADIVALGELGI